MRAAATLRHMLLLAGLLALQATAFFPGGAKYAPHVRVPPAASFVRRGGPGSSSEGDVGAGPSPRQGQAQVLRMGIPREGGTGVVFIDNLDDCRAATLRMSNMPPPRRLAVDIEARNLGRWNSKISLIQIGMEEPGAGTSRSFDERYPVYVFDIVKLQGSAFVARAKGGGGLRKVLQSESIQKILFDPGADSVGLFQEYGVELRNVLDLQQLYGLYTGTKKAGLATALEDFMAEEDFSEEARRRVRGAKERGRELVQPGGKRNFGLWLSRPLHPDLLEYAVSDVRYLIPMADQLPRLIRPANPVHGLVKIGTPLRWLVNGKLVTGSFEGDADEPDEVLVSHVEKGRNRGQGRVRTEVRKEYTLKRAAAVVCGLESGAGTRSFV